MLSFLYFIPWRTKRLLCWLIHFWYIILLHMEHWLCRFLLHYTAPHGVFVLDQDFWSRRLLITCFISSSLLRGYPGVVSLFHCHFSVDIRELCLYSIVISPWISGSCVFIPLSFLRGYPGDVSLFHCHLSVDTRELCLYSIVISPWISGSHVIIFSWSSSLLGDVALFHFISLGFPSEVFI